MTPLNEERSEGRRPGRAVMLFAAATILSCGGATPQGSDGDPTAAGDPDAVGPAVEEGGEGAAAKGALAGRRRPRDKDAVENTPPWGGFEMRPVVIPASRRRPPQGGGEALPFEIVLQDGHTEPVTAVAFGRDGERFFTGSQDRKIKIWTKEGVLVRTITLPGAVAWLAALPRGGDEVIWAGGGGHAYCFDLLGKQLAERSGGDYDAETVVARPDGSQLVTTSGTHRVTIRDRDFEPIRTVEVSDYKVTALAYSPRGDYFVTGGSPTEIENGWRVSARVWSPDGAPVANLEIKKPAGLLVTPAGRAGGKKPEDPLIAEVQDIDVSPDGRTIALLGGQNRVNLWRPDGTAVRQLKERWHGSDTAERCLFTPDGRSILLQLRKAVVKIGLDGQSEGGFQIETSRKWSQVGDVAVSPDGERFVLGRGQSSGDAGEGDVMVWNRFGELERALRMDAPRYSAVALSPHRNKLVLETEHGKASVVFQPGRNTVDTVAESIGYYRDGREYRFVRDGNVTIVDHQGQRTLRVSWTDHPIPMPDGNLALVFGGANHEINIYDAAGAPVRTVSYNGHGLGVGRTLALSPDLSFFAVESNTSHGGYHSVACVSLEHGERVADFEVKAPFESLTVGPDSRTIAVGHENGDISLWTRDGAPIKRLEGHATEVTAMTFDASGRYLVSASQDRTVRVWDVTTGSWTALVILSDGEWVAFDAAGRFDCSSGGRERVKLVRGLSAFAFRQFWDDFFTPGLIAKVMKGTRLEDVDVALKLQKAPSVTIEVVRRPAEGSDGSAATLKVCAEPNGSPVGDVFIFHNGRAIEAEARGIARVKRGGCRSFEVGLSPGYNSFVGAAYDATGVVFGQSAAAHVSHTPRALKRPAMHILAVGISDYEDRNISLLYPAADARAMAAVLEENAARLYGEVRVDILVNREGTRRAVRAKLDEIARRAAPADAVILYFAGHGETEGGAYYFLGHDADVTDLAKSAISISDLSGFAGRARANKIAIFLDTCKSGSATKQLGSLAMARSIEERKLIASLAKERGIAVFSAAGADQLAFEIKSLEHGIFTYCMLDYLRNKRYEVASNDMISVSKLLGMVSRATRDLAARHLEVEQTPILYMFGDDFSLGYLE